MKIGDLYTHGGKAYIVKAYHPNPKRILLLDATDGRVFSILKSIVRTAYTSSTQEGAWPHSHKQESCGSLSVTHP